MNDTIWAAIVGAIILAQIALIVFGRQFDCWVAAKRATYKSSGPDSGDYIRAERYDEIHSLLVKACVEIASEVDMRDRRNMPDMPPIQRETLLASIAQDYGIRLRWTGSTFEEDTTK